MELSHVWDYVEAGFRIFPLHGIVNGNKCECGDAECNAVGKHPKISNWPCVPVWSDEQLEFMLEHQLSSGFGVCLDSHLVIDVDPRNGGFESFKKLQEDTCVDFLEKCGFVVNTGGNGLHCYFSVPSHISLEMHLKQYPGIDFKSGLGKGSFVVGCGSDHISGNQYEQKKGFPQDLTQCPDALLTLLEKKTHKRTIFDGRQVDVTLEEVAEMVDAIPNDDRHYDEFIEIGMAIHQATNGEGYHIWDNWAQRAKKYDPAQMSVKWHSFGKSANPVTIGTLIFHAEEAGYIRPVTFSTSEAPKHFDAKPGELPFDTSPYDVKRPPGFVGKLAEWMNGNSYSEPLENLNCISSVAAVGNLIGLHTTDDLTNVSTNLLVLCVAESASGKEMVGTSYAEIMRVAGLSGAMAGGIKSKQEICRNLIEHQAAFYMIDEMGEVLRTIENAKKRGGAAYLEGVTGEVMSIFTKASSAYAVTGDTRRELVALLSRELDQCLSKVEKMEDRNGTYQRRADNIQIAIEQVKTIGLVRPFLSLIGYSVPASMDCIMSEEMAKNGFLSRALLAIEEKDNPKPRIGAKGFQRLPDNYATTIRHLASTGSFDMMDGVQRIEYHGERRKIKSTPDAKALLESLRTWEWEYAEHHRQTSGFTPLIRRSFELISKISTILAAPEGMRTVTHVEWAAVYVKRDLDRKIRHILDSIGRQAKDGEAIQTGVESRIINLCEREEGELKSVLLDKCKRKDVKREELAALLESMVERGMLRHEVAEYRGRPSERYFSIV